MPDFSLLPHPAHPSVTVSAITVTAERPARDRIFLAYRIAGNLNAIDWPTPASPEFAHELWMHTCLEAFIAGEGNFYRELNLSPSTRYAIYDFNGYRGDMRNADERDITIGWDRTAGVLTAQVTMPALADVAVWRVGLTTVIEDRSGSKSFWALSHPSPEPNFHHEASFLAELSA